MKKISYNIFTLVFSITLFLHSNNGVGQTYLPTSLLQLDDLLTHHIILVEKSTHRLFIYKNENGLPKLIDTFKVATGKIMGNKYVQGDHKTPEGMYQLLDFLPSENIINRYGYEVGKIYGIGAFTTNYPNVFDRKQGKTGGGIWIHSTDDESRISKGLDSRGCVVAGELNLKEISKYIELSRSYIVIEDKVTFLEEETWNNEKKIINSFIDDWEDGWKNKDIDKYMNAYSKKDFVDRVRGSYGQFKSYKASLFKRKETPNINFSNRSIIAYKDQAIVTMIQDYSSELVQDVGRKTLYLKKNSDYQWEIISEEWKKENLDDQQKFTPTQRYFANKEA